jgi:hypothetical protein
VCQYPFRGMYHRFDARRALSPSFTAATVTSSHCVGSHEFSSSHAEIPPQVGGIAL